MSDTTDDTAANTLPPMELVTNSDAIDSGLNDSDLGDPSGAGTTSPGFTDGERRWEEAVARAQTDGGRADPSRTGGLDAGPALLCGLCGALTVTLINEAARRFIPQAPRLDELGIRGVAKMLRKAGQEPPARDSLYWFSMGGDLISNAVFYSLAARAAPENALRRGALLGLAMGAGAVVLPEPLGLGRGPTGRSVPTQMMTVVWYLAGGLAAAGTARLLAKR